MKWFIELWSGLIIDHDLIRTVAANTKKDGSNQITVHIGYPNEDTITVHTLNDATAEQYAHIKDLLTIQSYKERSEDDNTNLSGDSTTGN